MHHQRVFVDNLGIQRAARLAIDRLGARGAGEVFVINRVSRAGAIVGSVTGLKPHLLDFDILDDVRLPGTTAGFNEVLGSALKQLIDQLVTGAAYLSGVSDLARQPAHEPYIHAYVVKRVFFELRQDLRSVLVAAWRNRENADTDSAPVLYVTKRWWFDLLKQYASGWGIELRPLLGRASLRRAWRPLSLKRWVTSPDAAILSPSLNGGVCEGNRVEPSLRVAVEMYSNGVRRDALYNTEFFWYRESWLPPGAVFGYFALPEDQPAPPRQKWLEEAGVAWLDRAGLESLAGVKRRKNGLSQRAAHLTATNAESPVHSYVDDFYAEYDRWRRFFVATRSRIHISTFDIFPASEALHAALADTGGVSVSIQRSIEYEPNVIRQTVTDVHFAFSRCQAQLEQEAGSVVRQFITSGYPFDDAFPAARAHGERLAAELRARGVQFIVCFLDENHGCDPKLVGGRRLTRLDYSFLCDRLATDRSLGLVLKPKRPDTLSRRLGAVWDRLQQFIEEGRCSLLAGATIDERYLPCAGACAADIAIALLLGGTAGLESYLAGTRTLLLRHGLRLGPFARLPKATVVFDTWEELWEAVERVRANPRDPNIGNWEPIVEQLASLRDGRSSERIRSYIRWLYEALSAGKSREEAIQYASRLYASAWGADLITQVTNQAGTVPVRVW